MTNREWINSLTNKEQAEFYTTRLVVTPIGYYDTICIVNTSKIAGRYSQSTIGVEEWLSAEQEFMTTETQ